MAYIHPTDKRITDFSALMRRNGEDLGSIVGSLFSWFDENIEYSRLAAPFFPLQRSDIDVISFKAGTCGDYSNLIVSVLLASGFEARYAYVRRDVYGDAQDHICAAINDNGRYVLIDAAQPYRKWHGYDCGHKEYELLTPIEFENRMRAEEAYWSAAADRYGRPLLAGLMYAPWLHAECVLETPEVYDDVFCLITLDDRLSPALNVYYRHYTPYEGTIPVMAKISDGMVRYRFSAHSRKDLWDERQWSEGFDEDEVPGEYDTPELRLLKDSATKEMPEISRILLEAGCPGLDGSSN